MSSIDRFSGAGSLLTRHFQRVFAPLVKIPPIRPNYLDLLKGRNHHQKKIYMDLPIGKKHQHHPKQNQNCRG